MRGFGVKDGERERFVALIEAAHADGQIGEADRDLRRDRARAADTRDELETLTRDLRPVHGAPPFPGPHGVGGGTGRQPVLRRVGGIVAGLGLFGVLVGAGVTGVVALAMFAASDGSDSAVSEEVVAGAGTWEVTAPQLEGMRRAYEQQHGGEEVWSVVVDPSGASVEVPSGRTGAGAERWRWEGGPWIPESVDGTLVPTATAPVDLRELDTDALMANIDATRAWLAPRARLVEARIADDGDGPRVVITVRGRGERGSLVTTLQGEVLDGPTRS